MQAIFAAMQHSRGVVLEVAWSNVRRCVLVVPVVLGLGAETAAQGDLIDSAACRQALASLEAHETRLAQRAASRAALAPPPGLDSRLLTLRRAAARDCLGGGEGPPQRTQRHAAPIVVPPVAGARAASPPMSTPSPALPSPALPTVVTACDAVGCWASDGSRLHRVGSMLQGPRGLCSVQGKLLVCP